MSKLHTRSPYLLLAILGLAAALLLVLSMIGPEHDERERKHEEHEALEQRSERAAEQASPPSFLARQLGVRSEPASSGIRGRVVDPTAGPLSEGRVELRCSDGALLSAVTIDEDGLFEGPSCGEGPTCVRLIHPGVEQPGAWELQARAAAEPAVELEARGAPGFSGTVVGSEGQAVAGADLLVRHGAVQLATATDAAGEFAVAIPQLRPCDSCEPGAARGVEPSCRGPGSSLELGAATVLVSAAGYAPTEFDIELDGDEHSLALAAAAPAILGIVRGSGGEAFDSRTRVLASNVARQHEQHAALVDDQGRFQFTGLAAGEYSLRAIRDEREIAALALARPGEEVELRSDLAAQGSALTVVLVDSAGTPVAGVRVDGGPLRAAVSDAHGRASVLAVLPGTYTLRLSVTGCAVVRETVELEPDTGPWVRTVRVPADC
jgi:hypothetical protein